MEPEDSLEKLRNEVEIVHLLYFRNKNQHRVARWWAQFSMLHRRCAQLVEKGQPLNKCQKQVDFIVYKLAPSAFRAFHSVIAQGQFIALGFALIAALARIHSILVPLATPKVKNTIELDASVDKVYGSQQKTTTGSPQHVIEDVGKTVSREEVLRKQPTPEPSRQSAIFKVGISGRTGRIPEKRSNLDGRVENYDGKSGKETTKNADKKVKDKKKKKKNAIDDIFGF
jgi:ribonuclease MRP protein subunit RMP1